MGRRRELVGVRDREQDREGEGGTHGSGGKDGDSAGASAKSCLSTSASCVAAHIKAATREAYEVTLMQRIFDRVDRVGPAVCLAQQPPRLLEIALCAKLCGRFSSMSSRRLEAAVSCGFGRVTRRWCGGAGSCVAIVVCRSHQAWARVVWDSLNQLHPPARPSAPPTDRPPDPAAWQSFRL